MHDDVVLRCQRTIERNPLRARMVADPLDHRWSSHRGNSAEPADPLITPYRAWRAPGSSYYEPRVAWRAFVMETVDLAIETRYPRRPDRYSSPGMVGTTPSHD